MPVKETALAAEQKIEQDLEGWIAQDPDILGEPLLIIGRQVTVQGINDRLDLLALDPDGKSVVIEVKRGAVKDPVDMQALRYASYLSRWKFSDFEALAREYLGHGDADFNFLDCYQEFCAQHLEDGDEVPTPNHDQRIVLIGSHVRERLGSVALWLREHKIDIKVIELRLFKEGDELLLEPITIVPTPVGKFDDVGSSVSDPSAPWKENGKAWHLETRCTRTTRSMMEELLSVLEDYSDLDGPHWAQKYYVSYQINGSTVIMIGTAPKQLSINFRVQKGTVEPKKVATELGIDLFQAEGSIAEKLALSSSVGIYERNSHDRVRVRCREGFKFGNAFRNFVDRCLELAPGN
jgi:hypothetical protein